MIRYRRTVGRTFVADQIGIDELKNEFFNEARQFIYFRKGEWHGILESIRNAIEWVQANPQYVATALALYGPGKDILVGIAKATGHAVEMIRDRFFAKSAPNTITRRVICSNTVPSGSIKEWEAYCGDGSVVTLPDEQVGQFRYIVNEKRYAVFSRLDSNALAGVIGKDKQTIEMLRNMFDDEFARWALKTRQKRGTTKRSSVR